MAEQAVSRSSSQNQNHIQKAAWARVRNTGERNYNGMAWKTLFKLSFFWRTKDWLGFTKKIIWIVFSLVCYISYRFHGISAGFAKFHTIQKGFVLPAGNIDVTRDVPNSEVGPLEEGENENENLVGLSFGNHWDNIFRIRRSFHTFRMFVCVCKWGRKWHLVCRIIMCQLELHSRKCHTRVSTANIPGSPVLFLEWTLKQSLLIMPVLTIEPNG